ncbi:autotransporter-associated N-terminal domain-containing protein [Fusobacterium nucleatum]|uniref:autotransporter adhesin RadD n=1 Tax=Fusobacterium nucleatum TaxID=851 RepID=UPI0023626257|nr:autotransporter-associated N-terminal domain-containing protein [Fusobacterium nucleatum]WDA46116.1 autotransporter-associated N-terminal domain-containing protein [Fusobacterium nucleatum]
MKDYKKVENCLKSFLKNNKRLSYSVALLVTFLINGGFSYADEAVQAPLRTELKVKIEKEQENISQMLKEAEESMKDIDLKIKKLTQRGQFWVKPLEKSNQVFFFVNWGNYSKNKNKTESNFNGPEYGSTMNYGQFYNGKWYGEYGVVKNPLEFVDSIDFGANITPKAVAEKTIVEKTVVKKDITAPVVTPPTIEVGEITLTAPEEVAIGEMEAPNEPNPSVTTPSTVPTLQGITVAAVSEVNVTPSTPEVAAAPTINAPGVQPPATPAGFIPRLITPPEAPVVTLPKIKIPEEIEYPGFGSSIQDVYDYWGGGNGATMIDQISITAGKFKATSGSGAYIQGYQGEGGYSATSSTLVKGNPTGTIPATNQFHSLSRNYFFGIRNSAFMQWASGVEISWFGQGGSQLIYMETANQSQQNLDKLNAGGVLGADLYNRINSYKTLSGLKDNGDGANGINLHNNKGNIYLGNSETRYQATTTIGGTRLSVFNNEGTITGLNLTGGENGTDGKDGSKKQVVYFNTPDTSSDQRWIYGNGTNGKINLYGSEAIAMYFTSNGHNGSNGYQKHVRTAFVNDGEINLYGINSSGVVVNQNQKLRPESGIYLNKPVHLYADGARGLYIPGDISNLPAKNVIVRVKIGEKGNDTAGFNWTDIQTGNTKNIKSNGNFEGAEYSTDYVDNAIGVMYTNASTNAKMQVPDITLEKHSKKGIGILALNGKLTVTNGNISIKGGIGNTALVAKKESAALPGGEIDYTGDINIGKSDIDNNVEAKEAMVAYAEGKDIKITGKVTVDSADSVSIYSKNGKVTVEGDVSIKSKGKNVVAMYTDNGTINVNRTALSGKTDIDITGGIDKGKATGVALYAKDGGKINAQKLSLKVTNGSAGIVSVGKNTDPSNPESNIDFTGGKLEYNGDGYAVYSDGTGKIDLSDAELNLHGRSTAFDVDLGASTLPTKLNSGTKIKVHSDDVIAFNLKRATGLTTVGGIETSIKSKIETKLGLGSGSLNNLFTGSTSNKYKVAAVDGGEITIGNLDKSGTAADTTPGAKKDGYEYFNRFLAQRLKATANGSTIKAVLDSAFANANFNGQVVGFEMNSSKNATSVDETAINLVNSKIMADRTDAGAGAIGAFINYGLVNIDATSKIEVEKENNVVNKQAVGVYAVNGSKVDNKGTIDVGGDQSVGILGMAYREDASHNPIVKEFGGKLGEGTVNITNEKDIKMSGKDAIGIYAMNNNTDTTVTSHLVTNKGTVEVGDSGEKTAVGIYAKGVNVKPEGGKIKIGKKAVGIYAEDSQVGEANKDLGTIDFNGDDGVGIYLKGSGSKLVGNKVTLTQSKDSKNKVGILADRGTNSIIKTEVAVGTLNNVIAYYSKGNNELNVQSNVTLNENSIGISGEGDLLYGDGTNTYTMKLGKSSTGLFGTKKIGLKDKTNIELNGENSVGAYASGADGEITSEGTIKFLKEKTIGLYGADGATIKDKTSMDFSNVNAKNNIGVYLAGANWERDTALTFSSAHEKGNIYLFAQGGSEGATDKGNKITLKNIFNVSPSNDPTGNEKTIGMYLDTAVKGKSTYVDNTVDMSNGNAKVSVTKKAIGIYAKNADNSKNNIINTLKVLSDGQGTVGVFTDGNLKLSGTGGLIEAQNAGIGLYGNKGTVTVEGTHKVEVTNAGTGMYLTKGSHLSGGKLELENKTAGTSAAGIYYEGTGNEVDHNTDIEVTTGENLLALYANGLKLNNNKEILIKKGKNNVAAYITGSSIFRNKGKIQLGESGNNGDFKSGIGVYVVDGEAINETGKTIDIYDFNDEAGLSVGMLAKAAGGKTAKIINAGTINANGEAIGMVVENDSEGLNDTGAEIVAKNEEPLKAIGAYINGASAKFTNKGKISAENIALALQGTTEGNIKNTGTLNLTKTGAVGVYAKDSVVDFNIAPTVAGADKTVALYASGTTKIKSQITSAIGKAHIGVYAEDDAEFLSGSKVTVGNGDGKDYGIGVYTKAGYNKTVNTDIKLTGEKTIGFYLGATGGSGSTVTHTGTIDVGSGIGAYIPEHSKFVAQNTTFNVGDKGTAVYLKGGEVDLGKTGTANINFNGTNGRAIYQDGGTITTGTGLHITGSGSFLTLKNANSSINSLVEVGANGIGINGIYDMPGKDYTLTLESPNGHIKLGGDKATGIAAVVKSGVGPNKVNIINKGVIETTSGEKTTGIYGKGANIENATGAKINIGAKGVGIYTTNDSSLENTTLNNAGEINLEGDEAVGIVAVKAKTNQDFVVGKITGTKNKLVGAYFKESLAATKVKDFDISLGDNAKGLVFDGGSDFTVTSSSTNKVKIGDTTGSSRGIGIAALGVNGTVSKTDVVVGKNSLGLYVKDKKLTFDLASGKLESSDANRSSILAYADGNNSEVALNGGGTLKVGANGIALGTKGGKITANTATTVEVDGVKGLGAYVENGGSIDSNFDIKVKSAEGIGMYAKGGAINSVAKVSEIKGNKSIGYVFENVTNAVNITNSVQLTDASATEQVGVVAQGTGNGLTVAGISVVGSENTGVYSSTGKAVTNNGTLDVGDSTGKSSIGIYSKGGAVTSNGNATIGKNSVGIYGKDAGVELSGDMTIAEKGIGLYVDNTDATKGDTKVTGKLAVGANGAIGIQATNSKIELGGDLTVGDNDSKGIFSKDAGDIKTNGDITVGKDSVGIYKEGTGKVETAAGKTLTVAEKGYGIYSKGAEVINKMNVTVAEDAIGAYVEGNDLTSTGTVTVGDKGVGLLVKGNGKTLTSTGNITVGSNNSVGLYAGDDANISQSGDITVADNNGIGVYSKGSGNVTTSGNITVGKDSIGVYKDGKGTMNIGVASQTMTIGEKSYGIYYKGNSVADSIINSNMNMTLGKEAVGIYGKNTKIDHTGNITVGETTIGSDGYSNPDSNKNSIGIFGDNSNINFKGTMIVDKPLSVGLYAANGGSITVKTGSTINVKNGGIGIMTGTKVDTITLESGSTLNVDGKATGAGATPKNVSFGITAYSGAINNQGTINVTNGATGIYLAGTASLVNQGTITVDATSKTQDKPGTNSSAELGGIKVTDKGVVTINGKVINGGTIKIKNGKLDMDGMAIDISTGKVIVDAKSISGVAEVLPNFSQGNSVQKVTVKDVFRTKDEGIGAFSGDVKSKSVSWIAKISKDPNDTTTTTKDITMVRIPYNSLVSGEKYKNLASGLEDVRSKIAATSSSPIFKSLDNISSHGDFAKAIANIRGDIYSNIQERMKTVESAFDRSYDELLSSYNKTRNVNKFSVIYTGGEHKDNTLGVSGYKHKTVGILYLNDREGFTYGGKYGWSAGIVGSNFEFKGDTNKGSKERVISGKLGLHYQTPLNKKDDNAGLKWLTRGELTVNTHRTKRNSQVGRDTYQNKASFYSTELSWKNTLSYDYDINTNWTVKPYAGIDMSYGHIFKIKEKNEGLPLEVKGKDYFVITPNVGVETKYVLPLGAIHQLFTKVDTEFSYDVTKLYHGVNKAKIKNASSGYYDLSRPEKRRAEVKVGAELGLEKENTYGVTFRAEYQGYKKNSFNYGVRLNYKF